MKIRWFLEAVLYRMNTGYLDAGDMSIRNMVPKNGKGYCELLARKLDFKRYFGYIDVGDVNLVTVFGC